MMTRNGAGVWFGRVTCLGIAVNLALALPTVIAPARMLAVLGAPPATPLVWVRFSALLLILLSLFYVPAARDPYRYPAVAWLAVLARAAGVMFFVPQAAYRMLGMLDLAFFAPELILLAVALHSATKHSEVRGEVLT